MMKKTLFSLVVICMAQPALLAQNIGINATGAIPHPSAMLDVSATDKGLLMPRMTTSQRNAIVVPAEGLKVYDTDTKTFWFYNGTGWIQSATGSPTNFWGQNGSNIFITNSGNAGIGTTTPSTKLTVHTPNNTDGYSHESDGGVILKETIGGISAAMGTATQHIFRLMANNTSYLNIMPFGNVGISGNNINPVNRLQIGDIGSTLIRNADFAIGNGTHAIG